MADDIEAIKQLKARYCRFLDTKDIDAWRALFAEDVVVTLDMAVSTGGADPQTAPRTCCISQTAASFMVQGIITRRTKSATAHGRSPACTSPERC